MSKVCHVVTYKNLVIARGLAEVVYQRRLHDVIENHCGARVLGRFLVVCHECVNCY